MVAQSVNSSNNKACGLDFRYTFGGEITSVIKCLCRDKIWFDFSLLLWKQKTKKERKLISSFQQSKVWNKPMDVLKNTGGMIGAWLHQDNGQY